MLPWNAVAAALLSESRTCSREGRRCGARGAQVAFQRVLPRRELDAGISELLVRERTKFRPDDFSSQGIRRNRRDGDAAVSDKPLQLQSQLVPRAESRVHAVVDARGC